MRFKCTYLLLFFHSISFSQNPEGKLKILLKDFETGISLVNDTINITINDSLKYTLISDNDGYTYFTKTEGKYSIKFYRKAYKPIEIKGILIRKNSTTCILLDLNKEGAPNTIKKRKKGVKLKLIN